MSDNGGYRMINLSGYDLQNATINCIDSIFYDLQKIDKPIMLTGITINGVNKAPIYIVNNNNVINIYDRKCTFTLGKITTEGVV